MVASVVLPLPGGPQNISENICPVVTILSIIFPFPVRWDWPTNSFSVLGRIERAKFIFLFVLSVLKTHFGSFRRILTDVFGTFFPVVWNIHPACQFLKR